MEYHTNKKISGARPGTSPKAKQLSDLANDGIIMIRYHDIIDLATKLLNIGRN